jgi:hypothetical protein
LRVTSRGLGDVYKRQAEIVPDDTSRFIESVKVRYLQGFGKPVTCISYTIVED